MSNLVEEELLSIAKVTGNSNYKELKPYLIPAEVRDLNRTQSGNYLHKRFQLGWDVEDIIDDARYSIVKTISRSRGTDMDPSQCGALVDRYYILDRQMVCLIARRTRFVDGAGSSVMFTENINGILFEHRLPSAFPISALSFDYRESKAKVTPSVFERGQAEDWESWFKDGLTNAERDVFFKGSNYWAIDDIIGLSGWKPLESLYSRLFSCPAGVASANDQLSGWKELFHYKSVVDAQPIKRLLYKEKRYLIEHLTQWLCTTKADDELTKIPCFRVTIQLNGPTPVVSAAEAYSLVDGQPLRVTTKLPDFFSELFIMLEEIRYRHVSLQLVRLIDDTVILSFVTIKGEVIESIAFNLAKRMMLNYGLMSAAVFTGRASR